MTQLTMNTWEGDLQNVAVSMRSQNSSGSLLLKARGMMTMRAVEVHTAFWVIAEEGMDKGEVVEQQCPQALEDQLPTNIHC